MRIIVEVKGGVVTAVYSDNNDILVDVLDYDNLDAAEEETEVGRADVRFYRGLEVDKVGMSVIY